MISLLIVFPALSTMMNVTPLTFSFWSYFKFIESLKPAGSAALGSVNITSWWLIRSLPSGRFSDCAKLTDGQLSIHVFTWSGELSEVKNENKYCCQPQFARSE